MLHFGMLGVSNGGKVVDTTGRSLEKDSYSWESGGTLCYVPSDGEPAKAP